MSDSAHNFLISGHTDASYDQELTRLRDLVLEMCALVADFLNQTRDVLTQRANRIDHAREFDRKINDLETQISKQATAMLALRNPKAIDLRFVLVAIRLTTILERQGDIAKNAFKRTAQLDEHTPAERVEDLQGMIADVSAMFTKVTDAFAYTDSEAAAAIFAMDNKIDAAYEQFFETLQRDMMANPNRIASELQLLFIGKNMERFGDYCTKMAKLIRYIQG